MTTTFQALSKTERLVRHLAACAIENQLEAHGSRNAVTPKMVENESEFHLEDALHWSDYFVGRQQLGSINRFWKDKARARKQIAAAVDWLFQQDAATVGRFIATADPGELGEGHRAAAQRHAEFLTSKGW
jgi:hypothetical protein